ASRRAGRAEGSRREAARRRRFRGHANGHPPRPTGTGSTRAQENGPPPCGGLAMEGQDDVIRFVHVHKEYPRVGLALNDVSFELQKGEFCFLTGHSGAGKSTILRLIHMADRPTSGEVIVGGYSSQSIRRREIAILRRKVSFIFQDFRLLPDRTAAENVAFALEVTGAHRSVIHSKVGRLLAQVGLSTKAGAYPNELSGGERQRVAIARALANDPIVLLAD